ncbi:MAG: glycosyltransferase family 39 protein [Chromatiaceae bacterium]|jgi:uncharacterized membrane protein|nr:glycosyltransferase family 39 protein [Chromatiaceae bacterium]
MRAPSAQIPAALLLIAAAAVLAGALARPYDLERMVVWHDEVFTAMRVFGNSQAEVGQEVFSGHERPAADLLAYQRPSPGRAWTHTLSAFKEHPEHAPLYYTLAWLAAALPAEPIAALRGTSAVLGVLLIPAVFWLARELFRDPGAAWVAAALVAISPLHLLYAQEARQYALWTVLVAAASAAFLRALRRGGRADWALYAVLAALGLWSHALTVLAVAAHGAYGVLTAGGRAALSRFLRAWGAALGLAVLLFAPWLWVMVAGAEEVQRFTGWMQRPISAERIAEAWGMHLVRVFADLPAAGRWLLLGLLPLTWVLWRLGRGAPARVTLFLGLLLAAFASAMLLPDLVLGGSRSLHPRYVLPGFLALTLAAAWVLAQGWDAPQRGRRLGARAGLMLVLALGLGSQWQILAADTWWSKNYSGENHRVAARVNAAERPLVLASGSGVGLGELISLAYDLDPEVRVWGEPPGSGARVPAGYASLFAVTPSGELRAQLGPSYRLEPVGGTWQWYQAVPIAGEEQP